MLYLLRLSLTHCNPLTTSELGCHAVVVGDFDADDIGLGSDTDIATERHAAVSGNHARNQGAVTKVIGSGGGIFVHFDLGYQPRGGGTFTPRSALFVYTAVYYGNSNSLPLQPRSAIGRIVPDLVGVYRVIVGI